MKRSILMLEQDEDDQYITRSYFSESGKDIDIAFVNSATQLFQQLSVQLKNSQLPSLIVLDYHAFPTTASRILADLRSNSDYGHIPVVVLSGSARKDIIEECYRSGAASFIQKPVSDQETRQKISAFLEYWFATVEL